MTRKDVQKLYTRFGGRWWEPFRAGWEFLTCREAIKDLESLMRRYVTADTRVLDAGCGTGGNLGRLLRLRLPFRDYIGLDFSPPMLALARKRFGQVPNARFVEADATDLPDTGERYGLIVSTWLLDHLDRPAEFVNSARRLLQPGGHMLVLFYSEPTPFLRFWFVPLGKFSVRATPVSPRVESQFQGVRRRKRYTAGLSTLVDVSAKDGSAGG